MAEGTPDISTTVGQRNETKLSGTVKVYLADDYYQLFQGLVIYSFLERGNFGFMGDYILAR